MQKEESFEFESFKEILELIEKQGKSEDGLDKYKKSAFRQNLAFEEMPLIIQYLTQDQDELKQLIACKALRKIVSTGREKIITQILDDYASILSIWLPKLLSKKSYQAEILWSLINLYLVSTHSGHSNFGIELIQNRIVFALCDAIDPSVENNILVLNMLSILLEDHIESFPESYAEIQFRDKMEYILGNDLVKWGSEKQEFVNYVLKICNFKLQFKGDPWDVKCVFEIFSKTENQGILEQSLNIILKNIKTTSSKICEMPQIVEKLLIYCSKGQEFKLISETSLNIIGKLLASQKIERQMLIQYDFLKYLNPILNHPSSSCFEVKICIWILQNTLADDVDCQLFFLEQFKNPESSCYQYFKNLIQHVLIHLNDKQAGKGTKAEILNESIVFFTTLVECSSTGAQLFGDNSPFQDTLYEIIQLGSQEQVQFFFGHLQPETPSFLPRFKPESQPPRLSQQITDDEDSELEIIY